MVANKTVIYNSTGKLKRVFLGKPTFHANIPVSDVARDLMDSGLKFELADKIQQHKELEDVFRQLDIEISWVELEPEKMPWQMFTRDFGVNSPDGILVGRFRYLERKGEEIAAKRTLDNISEKVLAKQITKGAMEGGDSFWLNEEILVIGNGNRSTYAGFDDAKEILAENGRRVYVVEFLSKWNHLDNNFGPLADKLAIVNIDAVPDYFIGMLDALGWELIKVPGEYGRTCEINVLALGEDRVLSFRGNRLNDAMKAHGLKVYDPDYSIFIANGGGIHCSTFELERER